MSQPPQDPTRQLPVTPPAAVPYPVGTTPAAPGADPPAAPVTPRVAHLQVEAGRFWAGVLATALVAALVGVVGIIVIEQILKIKLVVKDPFALESHLWIYVVGGVLCALAAGAVLHLLVLAAPRPQSFFAWIVGLATVVAALLPLTWTDDRGSAAASGLVNLAIGIAIWSLLSGVLSWTVRRA